MKKVIIGSAVIMVLGITNAYANAYRIVDKVMGAPVWTIKMNFVGLPLR